MEVGQKDAHLAGKGHAAATGRRSPSKMSEWHCGGCDRRMGVGQRDAHLAGKAHAQNTAAAELLVAGISSTVAAKGQHNQSLAPAGSGGRGGRGRRERSGGRGHDVAPPLEPPFPEAAGSWIPYRSFRGRKSFGHFVCERCQSVWTTAHATNGYKQGCKGCEHMSFPRFMWENDYRGSWPDDEEDATGSDEGEMPDKPHHSQRCEACRMGVCIR